MQNFKPIKARKGTQDTFFATFGEWHSAERKQALFALQQLDRMLDRIAVTPEVVESPESDLEQARRRAMIPTSPEARREASREQDAEEQQIFGDPTLYDQMNEARDYQPGPRE